MQKRAIFFIIIIASAAGTAIVNFFFLFLFHNPQVTLDQLLLRAGLPGVGYILLVTFVLIRNAASFDAARFAVSGEAYVQALKKLGSTPVKMIAFNVLSELAFLGLIFIQGENAGIQRETAVPLFFAAFSLGMLIGTFIYVLVDSLVSKTLISYNLTVYPRDLRENRQGLKLLIIPIAVALMSLLFAFSITLLTIYNSGGSLPEINPQSGLLAFILTGVFFVSVIMLASTLKKNAGLTFNSIIVQLEHISSAKKDLVKRISLCSVDELGTIAGMINSFCDNIGNEIRDLRGSQHKLAASSVELGRNATDMDVSVSRISGGADQVRTKIQNQMISVSTSSTVIEEIAKNIESLNISISRQSSSVSASSTAVEKMVENVKSIGIMVEKMLEQFRIVDNAASKGGTMQKESGEKVQKIAEESKGLQEANKIIAAIAAQTNLLAMNAAIEAAHAGDTGRGFSVVAGEIRKLAESSSLESQKISAQLKQITGTIDDLVAGAKASEQVFGQVSLRVGETGKLVSELNSAIRKQQEGAGQVLDALRVMNDITTEVKTGSREMTEGNVAMLQEMNNLRSDSREISSGIEEMVESVSRVNKNTGQVSMLAANVQSAIKDITVIVDSFEV